MIQWLRDKFSFAISFFFIVNVIASSVLCGYALYSWSDENGLLCLIGLVLGMFLGIVDGVLVFGFFATVVHISDVLDVKFNIKNEEENKNEYWMCGKCKTINQGNICTKCGEKKSMILT